jgi:GNAT superfamily N-acetyltransferase
MQVSQRVVEVRPVLSRRDRRRFLTFPWRIYRHDPMWAPPVLADRAARIDPARNPLYDHGEVALFIAWSGRKPVGTVGVAVDEVVNAHRAAPMAVFGFFECVEDCTVAEALLDRAAAWARDHGAHILHGPQSFGASDEPGILVEGRATPRGLLMGWTPPYYRDFIERYRFDGRGFEFYHDALAYRVNLVDYVNVDGAFEPAGNLRKVADYVRRRYSDRCRLRTGNLATWDAELEKARLVYNRALGVLRDFTPMTPEEWRRMSAAIRPLLQEDLALFVMLDGEPVCFALGLPDITMALWHCNGLRTPWDYAKLWWHSRRLPGVSFKIMAMAPEVHGLGLDALVYEYVVETCWRKGYAWIDMSLTGSDNPATNKLATRFGAHVDKRYRVYELEVKG